LDGKIWYNIENILLACLLLLLLLFNKNLKSHKHDHCSRHSEQSVVVGLETIGKKAQHANRQYGIVSKKKREPLKYK